MTTIYLDISPLMEFNWTGIAVVTRGLAMELLRQRSDDAVFFFGDRVVSSEAVARSLRSPGGYLLTLLRSGNAVSGGLTEEVRRRGRPSLGIFPNIKQNHRIFDCEILIVHDLSFMICPELHSSDTVLRHSRAIQRDVETSDLICCVSESTRQDVIAYLGVDERKVFTSHLGLGTIAGQNVEQRSEVDLEPSVLVLGTREPRKNGQIVLDFLERFPEIARGWRFIFVGRPGWRSQFSEQSGAGEISAFGRANVLELGYVTETLKQRLLARAAFAVYPSLFEGFGLPVVEAMAVGCPTITSRSSSLVELGVPERLCFDPLSVSDFARAFAYTAKLTTSSREELGRDLARLVERTFTWENFVKRIMKSAQRRLRVRR